VFDDLQSRNGSIKLRLLIDRLSVESFAFDGERYFAAYSPPQRGAEGDSITAHGGAAHIKTLEIRRLGSAWQAATPAVIR
jgi:sucrose-6-phosphate hydrolase SacC (GH32 family)